MISRSTLLIACLVAGSSFIAGCAVSPVESQESNKDETAEQSNAPAITQLAVVTEQPVEMEASDIADYLPGYQYVATPTEAPSEVAFWVTREEDSRFHVPWYIGGDWYVPESEKVLVDPVNKTISLGFDQLDVATNQCDESAIGDSRASHGYILCNSQFAMLQAVVSEANNMPAVENEAEQSELSFWQRVMSLSSEEVFASDQQVEGDGGEGVAGVADDEVVEVDQQTLKALATYEASIDNKRLALAVIQLNLLDKAKRAISGESETLEALEARLTAKLKASQTYYETSLTNTQKKIVDGYINAADRAPVNVSKQVIDKSGYFNYDVEWPVTVTLKPVPINALTFQYDHYVDEFKAYKVTDASEPLANLTLSKMKNQYQKDRLSLGRYLKKATRSYSVACELPEFVGDYKVSVKCPDYAQISTDGIVLELTVEVVAKRFGLTIPRYTNYNNDLTVVADSKTLSLENNSQATISIERIEWLANGAAQSITRKTDKDMILAIAQGQTAEIKLADFVGGDIEKELDITYLSRRQALRKYLDYGFDISYQIESEDKNLPKSFGQINRKNRYNLNEILMSR